MIRKIQRKGSRATMFHSLRAKILLVLLFVAFSVFGILGYYTYKHLEKLPPLILNQYQELADARANEFSQELRGLENQIEMIALSNIIVSMDMEEIKPYLKSLVNQERFTNFTISDVNGDAWSSAERLIDISNQQQFKEIIINNNKKNTSNPFFSPFFDYDYPIITISHAIKQDNQTIGIVNGVVTTKFIDDIVSDISFKDSGYAWVIDDQGNIISHPQKDITILDNLSSVTSLKEYDFLGNKNGTFTFSNNENNNMLGIYSSIDHTSGWRLILTIDEDLAYNEVNHVIEAITYALIAALLILIVFSFWISRRLTQPLLNLKKIFEAAAAGNLNVKAVETKDEIGDAAKSFNTMLSQIKHLTFVDPITGLDNYFSFLNEVHHMDIQENKNQDLMYVVIVSIDNFKRINNFYGYEFGNDVLKELGENITSSLVGKEIVARYFSDEMILTMRGNNEQTIESRLEEIIQIFDESIEILNVSKNLELSCGVARLNGTDVLENVIRKATLAKLKAKATPTKKIVFYNWTIEAEIQQEQRMEDALNKAIINNQLRLVYQPIYDTIQQKTIGYEALLRWDHPLFGSTPISTVIDIAETNGMIIQIGEWVFETAVLKLKKLHTSNPDLFMSINVSSRQLVDMNFTNFIQDTIQQSAVSASKITLEITETTTMMDVQDKKTILTQVKEMGLCVSIDDFGTGYSSLNYLSQLPIDTIKIDKQFIQLIDTDKYSRTLVASVIAIAKALKLKVIAEGVETIEGLTLLQELGCTIIQGYYISKPISLDNN